MPQSLQAKLLRVLGSGTILPLGAASERSVDVRVLAATNSDLQADLSADKFRQDLYFRLARFVMSVPLLRERREDLGLLAEHFLHQLATEMGMTPPRLSPATREVLERYDFPGNVRERRNLVERALIESGGGEIQPGHLRFVFPHGRSTPSGGSLTERAGNSLATPEGTRAEKERIVAYVREHGSISNAQCRELWDVGMHRACYLLRPLHRADVLKQDSSGRWAQYRLP